MKINRGFLNYLLILLAFLLGAFLICVVIMIFVPEFSLWGLRYYKENISNDSMVNMTVQGEEEEYEVKLSDPGHPISKIDVNAPNYFFKIYKSNDLEGINYSMFRISFVAKTSGFTTEKEVKANIDIRYSPKSGGTLTINAVGPTGFLSFGEDLSIVVQVPPSYNTSAISLEVEARNVLIGDSHSTRNPHPSTLPLKAVKLKGSSINITDYATIGQSGVDDCLLEASRSVGVKTEIKAKSLSMKLGEGTSTFYEELKVAAGINIETDNTFVHFNKTIDADFINLKNVYGKMYFKDVTGNVVISDESKKCDHEFEKILGKLTLGSYLNENMADGCNLRVDGEISGEVLIATTGNININKVQSSTKIKNTSGNITIAHVYGAVDIKTVNSKIVLGEVKDEEGKFVLNGINARVSIETTGKGSVSAYFNTFEYAGDLKSNIKTKNGEIKVFFKKDINRNITAKTTKTLKYLGNSVEGKEGTWKVGSTAKVLNINSENANISIE